MKVFVFGAAGFIGFPVSQALLRAGHTVFGQTRSQDRANKLAANEIIPVVAKPGDVSSWESAVIMADVVIEALAGLDLKTVSLMLLNAVGDLARKRPEGSAKPTYVYTSGTWIHGNDTEHFVTDTTPICHPVSLVAWRGAVEQEVINHPDVNGIVIRPSMVYGRSGSIFARMFQSAYDGKLTWPGEPGGRLAVVHQDDLADFFVRAAERGALVKGLIFDASEDTTQSTDEVLAKLAKVAGLEGSYEYVKPENLYEEAIASTTLVRPYLGRTLLGWQPRRHGIWEDLELYYNAWKANAGKK
ncbi:NAD(P)-binding protein [Cytidiella melzeri]|nr:NAD(P)-binding protein [Cytidiella melzeri]